MLISEDEDPFLNFNYLIKFEKDLLEQGLKRVTATTFYGAKMLVGPVVACSVLFDIEKLIADPFIVPGPSDESADKTLVFKKLGQLEEFCHSVIPHVIAYQFGEVRATEFDNLGERGAKVEAMRRAYENLQTQLRLDEIVSEDLAIFHTAPDFKVSNFLSIDHGFYYSLGMYISRVFSMWRFKLAIRDAERLLEKRGIPPGRYRMSWAEGSVPKFISFAVKRNIKRYGYTEFHRPKVVASVRRKFSRPKFKISKLSEFVPKNTIS